MSNTTEHSTREIEIIAGTIRVQIGGFALMCQGARDFYYGNFTLAGMEYPLPGLRFTAKPKTRLVDVYVLLEPSDTYRIVVRKRNVHVPTSLYEIEGVYADQLGEIITHLDSRI